MCTEAGAALIVKKREEENLNRIIVCACTPKTHLRVFARVLRENGMDPSYLEFVNIREQCSYVHMHDPIPAQQQAEALIRAAVQRAHFAEIIPIKRVDVLPKTLVIGGGIAGIQSALDLANQGYEVHLVEQSPTIGGIMARFDRIFPTDDCCI